MKTFLVIAALALVPACKKNAPPEEGGEAPKAEAKSEGTAEPKAEGKPEAKAEPGGETAAGGDEYKGSDTVAGGGTISGTVTYAGTEKDTKVTITKDEATCCAACKVKEKMAETLVVAGGKLANAVIYLPDVKAGKKMPTTTATVNNTGCAFDPHVAIGYKGANVAAKNSDPVLHNTHLFLQQGNKDLVNIALPSQGQVVEKPLKKPGVVSVKCDAHEWMQAYIYVAANPYAAVSGKDGSFKLENVPPGEYNVKVWHERLGDKEAKIKLDAGGNAKLDIAY